MAIAIHNYAWHVRGPFKSLSLRQWHYLNPSSAVIEDVFLIINNLRLKSAIFLHYILHKFRAFG